MRIRINHSITVLMLCLTFPLASYAQSRLEGSGQSSGALDNAESAQYKMSAIAGQASAIGKGLSAGYILESGFFTFFTDSSMDIIPPDAPSNLTIEPDTWSRINSFTIHWTNPENDEHIDGAYYKIGQAPGYNDDGTYMAGAVNSIEDIRVGSSGAYTLFLWLRDKSGNYSCLNRSSVTLYFDNSPPELVHSPITLRNINESITVVVSAGDQHSGVSESVLIFRNTGLNSTMDTVSFSGNQALISKEQNTQQGLEYRIEVTDNAGNMLKKPDQGYYAIQAIVSGEGPTLKGPSGQPVATHFGDKVTDYRIFSVPFILDNKTPASVFEDDLGDVDNTKWRCYSVQDGALQEYADIRTRSVVEPGKGFLLIVNAKDVVIDAGSGISPKPEDFAEIQLTAGWNLVGNPFDLDIPLDSLHVNDSIPEAKFLSENGWSENPGYLKKWEGLAIHSETDAVLKIGIGGGAPYQNSIQQRFSGCNWGLRLKAIGENSRDLDNYLGIRQNKDPAERTKWHEPLKLPEAVVLQMDAQKEDHLRNSDGLKYSSCIQNTSSEGNTWDIEVFGGVKGERVEIGFEKYGQLPDSFQIYLVDWNAQVVQHINPEEDRIVFITDGITKHEYRLIVGNASYAQNRAEGLSLIPLTFSLRQNFPNPFNPGTTIRFNLPRSSHVTLEIFNTLGQKVDILLNGVPFEAGYYSLQWTARNKNGESLPSGMYLIRLVTETDIGLRKALLIH